MSDDEYVSDVESEVDKDDLDYVPPTDLPMPLLFPDDDDESEDEEGPPLLDLPPNMIKSKNGTVWDLTEPPVTRRKAHNIVTVAMGLKGGATDGTLSPMDFFKLMVTPEIAATTAHTNAYATVHRAEHNQRPWKEVDEVELYAFIGILLLAGVEKAKSYPVERLWSSDPKYPRPPFTATMSVTRFMEIRKFIRMDDKHARDAAREAGEPLGKLAPVQEVFHPFVQTLASLFEPSPELCVDEMLLRFRGAAAMRVYMKSKPGRYGVKIWALVDCDTGFALKLVIYQGKEGDVVERGLGKKVVMTLMKDYVNTGRGVTMDNFFTSKELAEELLKKKTTLLGTIRKHRVEVPVSFSSHKKRVPLSSMFGFSGDVTLVSYCPSKNKTVLLLSTQHHGSDISTDSAAQKPQMIMDYNRTKGAVDTSDQMVGTYSCQRATRRWPMKVFFLMLDVAGINSFILWKQHNTVPGQPPANRRDFIVSLAEGLMTPLIQRRSISPYSSRLAGYIKSFMALMGFPVPRPPAAAPGITRGRCQFCLGGVKARKQSLNRCLGCDRFVCADHAIKVFHCHTCQVLPVIQVQPPPDNNLEEGNPDLENV